jgi:hypothetical protein
MKRGYEVTYEWVIELLRDCDFQDASRRLNIRRIFETELVLDFVGHTYSITKDRIVPIDEKIKWPLKSEVLDYNIKSVLGYYVLSEAVAEPGNDFCQLGTFSHGVFQGSGNDWLNDSLGKAYGADYRRFSAVIQKLGMAFESGKGDIKYVWQYNLLPKIPVKVIWYEGDDEYPSTVQILYEKTAIQFFKFEPLCVLAGCFIEVLTALGNTG